MSSFTKHHTAGRLVALTLSCGLGALGCPQLLSNDFQMGSGGVAMGSAGGTGNNGGAGSSGAGGGSGVGVGTNGGAGGVAGSGGAGAGGTAGMMSFGGSSGSLPDAGTGGSGGANSSLLPDAEGLFCDGSTSRACNAGCQQCCADEHCDDEDPCTADSCDGSGQCAVSARCETGGLCCEGIGCSECCENADCGGAPLVCTGGLCVAECSAPTVACGQACKNLVADAEHCGACDYSCGLGRTCDAGACSPAWRAVSNAPSGLTRREVAGYGAMGDKVFIYGGRNFVGIALSNGAVYDPNLDSWNMLPTGGPSARISPAVVWTGSEMFVWGGGSGSGLSELAGGALYNPTTDQWSAISTVGAPTARRAAHVFWTGTRVLLWGGISSGELTQRNIVYQYDPGSDVWTTGSGAGVPPFENVLDPVVAWSGNHLYVYGGSNAGVERDTTFEYDPITDLWKNRAEGPTDRSGAFGQWDGSGLVVWGGINDNFLLADGRRWLPNPVNPSGGAWGSIASNPIRERLAVVEETGWIVAIGNSQLLLVGGKDESGNNFEDTMIYDSSTNLWTNLGFWPSGDAHVGGVGVWTGQEFVLWGGLSGTGNNSTNDGERFRP